jgi:hypothetical protein
LLRGLGPEKAAARQEFLLFQFLICGRFGLSLTETH